MESEGDLEKLGLPGLRDRGTKNEANTYGAFDSFAYKWAQVEGSQSIYFFLPSSSLL